MRLVRSVSEESRCLGMDRMRIYEIIYALTSIDGREDVLFGNSGPYAREAFSRSLTGQAFPEIWFELPLLGEPWLDFHSLVSYDDVAGTQAAYQGHDGVYADALRWFAAQQPTKVRQLALSYDTRVGDIDNPAVQLLVNKRDPQVQTGFLKAVGREDAVESYLAFANTMQREWYDCYIGTFPGRQETGHPSWVRVECIVIDNQREYANNIETMKRHLANVGLVDIDEDALLNIHFLARSSFPLEFQFNIDEQGKALPVLSASIRFSPQDWNDASRKQEIVSLMLELQSRGLADSRWQQLASSLFAKRVSHDDESSLISCCPTFVKLRWRAGEPLDAKAYLIAQAE